MKNQTRLYGVSLIPENKSQTSPLSKAPLEPSNNFGQISGYLNFVKEIDDHGINQSCLNGLLQTHSNKNSKKKKKYTVSESYKWRCSCGKTYHSYSAIYLHKKNKHANQEIVISCPINKRNKGRPKKEVIRCDWSQRIYQIAQKLSMGLQQWKILTALVNQYSIKEPIEETPLYHSLCTFLNKFTHPFTKICIWLLKYHLGVFRADKQNSIYLNLLENSIGSFPLLCNIIGNWWESNGASCLVEGSFLRSMLEIFCQWLYWREISQVMIKCL